MILKADELVDLKNAIIQPVQLPAAQSNNISVSVIRIDKIHAIISGNKWFKLKYNLENALRQNMPHIITFGGAWSNHIAATAFLCQQTGLQCTGFIRGEKPALFSETLRDAERFGMELNFVSRESYRNKNSLIESIQKRFPDSYIIPEGGENEAGIRGASEILDLIPENQFTHIACAIGTGTTMAGLVQALQNSAQIVGIPVLKFQSGKNNIEDFIKSSNPYHNNWSLFYDYHFGGYAKFNDELISFMNQLYRENGIPTDIVYTGKLFYAVNDLIAKKYYEEGSNILMIHSGGLQGNRSLPEKMLIF